MRAPFARSRDTARQALRLRAWAARVLLHDEPHAAPDAGAHAWEIFLHQERCAAPLQRALADAAVELPPGPAAMLRNTALRETRRALSLRAQLQTVARIAREENLTVAVLKSGADVASGLTIHTMDVDVLASPDEAQILAARLDACGFSAQATDGPWHLRPRMMTNALTIEVHRAVIGFADPEAIPWRDVVPVAGLTPLVRLAPHDHAWTVLCQAVHKHPDRRRRIRDLLILREALRSCDPEGMAALESRIAATSNVRAFKSMIEAVASPHTADGATRRVYLVLARTRSLRRSAASPRVLHASLETAASSGRDRFRRAAEHREGSKSRLRQAAIAGSSAAVAASLAIDEPVMRRPDIAAVAAWQAPFWIRDGRWRSLLQLPDGAGEEPDPWPAPHVAAVRLLRLLARLPFSPWRSTCLYRSVAACLAMRRWGIPAVLRLGAAAPHGSITAHAWVEDAAGRVLYESPAGHEPLKTRPAG